VWQNVAALSDHLQANIQKYEVHLVRICTGVLISSWPYQEGNKLQRQKILSFIYPIYNHNWRNIVLFIYITRLASNEIF